MEREAQPYYVQYYVAIRRTDHSDSGFVRIFRLQVCRLNADDPIPGA